MKYRTRVIVAHGHCMLRSGLEERLIRESWIDVCAVTSSVADVEELIFEHRPDVILMNVASKCSSGMAALEKLRRNFVQIKILAFSCSSEYEDVHGGLALNSGADGYISSADTLNELVAAIRTVRTDRRYVSPQTEMYLERVNTSVPGFTALSRREAEVFCLTGCGYVTKRIAEMMELEVKTVESYRERIRKKLHLKKGADLLYAAVSFMRSAARSGADALDDSQMITELLSARA